MNAVRCDLVVSHVDEDSAPWGFVYGVGAVAFALFVLVVELVALRNGIGATQRGCCVGDKYGCERVQLRSYH